MGAAHGASKERTTWKERLEQEAATLGETTQPHVLVIGGGQGIVGLHGFEAKHTLVEHGDLLVQFFPFFPE